MRKVYLDNAATTAIDDDVIRTITHSMIDNFGNPSSTHQFGRKAKAAVEMARKSIANILNCKVNEVIFTAGGSEADNLILRNAIVNLDVKRIISSKIEHHAVLHTLEALAKEFEVFVDFVHVNTKGEIDLNHLEQLLLSSQQKTLVSLMFINNEIGNILNLNEVAKICKDNNALFHSDTVQGLGHYTLDLGKTPVDFITASAHKFHGPKGVGFAVIKQQHGIKPLLIGGEQEHGARAGTENVHSIVGMEKALQIANKDKAADRDTIIKLKDYFIAQLKMAFAEIEFNGNSDDLNNGACHILNVRFAKEFPMLLFQLDLKGIAASGGSACQSGSNKGSHVLNHILSPEDALKTSIRFSFNKHNTIKEIDYVIAALKEIIH